MAANRGALFGLLALVFVGAVSIPAALYARDETLAPCGMLRAEMKRSVLALAEREGVAHRYMAAYGDAPWMSAATSYNLIDAATSRYDALTCARLLVRLELRGELPSGITL
jgi:hypothetical protein